MAQALLWQAIRLLDTTRNEYLGDGFRIGVIGWHANLVR